MTISPFPGTPEKPDYVFETKYGTETRVQVPGSEYMEGVARDTDVPQDFQRGAYGDTAPTSMSKAWTNPEHVFKRADETMKERAHVGSASWIEAPSVLSEFSDGAFAGHGLPEFSQVRNPGTVMRRENAARVG